MKINSVLLVDDDHIANYLHTRVIKKIDFAQEVIVKDKAREALDYIIKDCKNSSKYPDLILLDLKMPGMDGFEFVQKFEAECRQIHQSVVVVFLSSSRNSDDVARLKSLGNYFLMNKPLTRDKLEDIYSMYFKKDEAHY